MIQSFLPSPSDCEGGASGRIKHLLAAIQVSSPQCTVYSLPRSLARSLTNTHRVNTDVEGSVNAVWLGVPRSRLGGRRQMWWRRSHLVSFTSVMWKRCSDTHTDTLVLYYCIISSEQCRSLAALFVSTAKFLPANINTLWLGFNKHWRQRRRKWYKQIYQNI